MKQFFPRKVGNDEGGILLGGDFNIQSECDEPTFEEKCELGLRRPLVPRNPKTQRKEIKRTGRRRENRDRSPTEQRRFLVQSYLLQINNPGEIHHLLQDQIQKELGLCHLVPCSL